MPAFRRRAARLSGLSTAAAVIAVVPLASCPPVKPGITAALTAAYHRAVGEGAENAAAPAWIGRIRWRTQQVATGVTVRYGVLSDRAARPYWTVTIDATTTSSITGAAALAELGRRSWAATIAKELRAAGYSPHLTAVYWPGYSDVPRGLEGMRVRVGEFSSPAAARSAAYTLQSQGFATATVEWTGYGQDQLPDAEQIREAVIDPAHARIEVTHHGIVARRQLTSAVARAMRAVVAANAGFFITSDSDGFQGVPAGLAVYGGQVESMNNGWRAALILAKGRPRIDNLKAAVTIQAGRASYPVNGINRIPGVIEDCGRPGSRPTAQPRQDITCSDAAELVLFTSQFGANAPSGSGVQATLNRDGQVIQVGAQAGGYVPSGGWVVQGIGAAGSWLIKHAVPGRRLVITERVSDRARHTVALSAGVSIASAAPALLKNGHLAIDAATEGVIVPADLSFGYSWAEERQPRTIAGIDRRGRLILVTVDGRQPGVSEGATLSEEASLMQSLGAVDAMNLDGGGSTVMVVNGRVVDQPSDYAERADGDFVVVLR